MDSKINLNFKVYWIGDEHVVIAFQKKNDDTWREITFSVREYAEFMNLLHEFNTNFKEKLDQKLVELYLNDLEQ